MDICLKKAQKGDFEPRRNEGARSFFYRIFRMVRIFAVEGGFAGVALRLPVDQSWLCPLEASFFGPNPP